MALSRSNKRQPVAKRNLPPANAPDAQSPTARSLSAIAENGDPRGWVAMLTAAFVLLCVAGVTLLLVASAGNA